MATKKQHRDADAPTEAQVTKSTAVAEDLMNMDEAIAMLKTAPSTFYRWLRSGKIKGYKVGRQWRFQRQDLERFLKGQQPKIDLPISPDPMLRQLSSQLASVGHKVSQPGSADDPVSEAINMMIKLAYYQHADDLHLSPCRDGQGPALLVRCRIDGILHTMARLDLRLLGALMERWKSMAGLNVAERRLPQDGRLEMAIDGQEADIRVSTMPTAMGESLTARVLVRQSVNLDIDKMGYGDADRQKLVEALRQPGGLIIVNGPTGVGKTTTLYGCLSMLAGPETKIMTVEDPVEFLLPWALQTPVNERDGMTFTRAIIAMLRSAVNVIMVGEIRNSEIANLCAQAALTGHLVLTTLHAEDSAQALHRLVEIGVPAFVVGDAARLILSQRLVRRLCPDCCRPAVLTPKQQAAVSEAAMQGGLRLQDLPSEYRQPVGCAACHKTGYAGRTVIAETMRITAALALAVRKGAAVDELRRIAISEGMTSMAADGIRKAASGITTLAEIERVIGLDSASTKL